jgi:hypothetical protein
MGEQHRGFTIKPKRDFGGHPYFIRGKTVWRGFVVVRDGINVMPAATWFYTVEHAKVGIDCLIESDGNAQHFYDLLQAHGSDSWEPPPEACQKEPADASSP